MTNKASSRDCELSDHCGAVVAAMDAITNTPFNGMTNISAGINAGIGVLTNGATARPFAEKVMVLFTDGRYNEGAKPSDTAAAAAAQRITIHTVTFGEGANQTDMQAVAAATGGEHHHAPSASSLKDIFYEIGASMPTILTE
jgi:Mg-chelatase subunit ChlD